MATVHDRMNDRQAMWLWQSSGNLAMPQTIVTHREALANKPYCSMNNLASNSGHGIGKRMERIASLDPIFGEDEELNGSSINGFTKMPQRQHLPSVRGSAWDICREGRYDQRKSSSVEQPNSKGAVKKQSAFVRGLCDLASVERLKMWKAKLPLVSRNRHSSKATATATTTFAAVVAAGAQSRSRRLGQQSPLAMAEEGNYDVPVTPNRFDQESDSKSAAAPISTGTRMVNAYLYYQQRKAAAGQIPPQERRTNEHSDTVANGNPSSQQLANRVYRKGQQQFRDVMEQRRPRYFASAYAQNSAYDNPENLMPSRKLRSINEIESKRSGSSSRHSNAMVLPPPVKIVACGGVPVNPDQPRLVKPSAFRPVQPSGWQTAKASLVEVTEDSDKRKPVGVTPPFPVGGGSKSIRQKHFPSGATKVTVGGDCLSESTSLGNAGEVDQLNGGGSSSGHLHSLRSNQSNSDKQSIQAEEYVVTQSSSLPQSRGPSSERCSLSSPVKMSRQEKFDQIVNGNGTSSSYGCQAALGAEAQTNPGQTRQSTSRSSRNSSGIQVTPSPSDSGVAEIEATLREKDAEIANLRSTMEHNEQVIIRVYQEKEERWQEKLRDWGSRLQASVRNEQRLLSQIHCMREEMGEYQTQINNLFAEKQGLQKKIRQMENEVFELRAQLSNRTKQWSVCKNCSSVFVPQTQQQNQELCPSSSTDAVRNELEALRLEICEIRHSLQGQAA